MKPSVVLIAILFLLSQTGFTQKVLPKDQKIPDAQERQKYEEKKKDYEKNKIPQKERLGSKIEEERLRQEGKAPALEPVTLEIKDPIEETDANMDKKLLRGPAQFDSRIELRQLDPLVDSQLLILRNASSVGLVIRKEILQPLSDSVMRLTITHTLGEKYSLCPGEAFAKQPVAGEGTAFIVNDTSLMTAAHVLDDSLHQYAVVFGYELVNKVGAYETDIRITNIFYPTRLAFKDNELDVTIFNIDRQIDRMPLTLSNRKVNFNERIYAIGYPSGLPEKVSINASVRTNDHVQYFYTTLDAFQGNSGSPVFNIETHEVIGVLVSGELDYHFNGNCNTATLCSIPFCNGEKVIRISEVLRAME